MTTPRYATTGCTAMSQEQGLASPSAFDSAFAWLVDFNDGNSNRINRNNNAFVRAVRSAREYQGDQVSFRDLYEAWILARAKKVPSRNQLAFEANWIDGLLQLQGQINAGTWSPRPTTCFVAQRPKARQIHAPDFSDRVVHHWLVPKLEAMFERGFIHDSYANRCGKGTHAAVDRLRDFVRSVHSGQNSGWYLQLDVRNFFNTIHRPTLYAMLKRRMQREHAPEIVQRTAHALLRASVQTQGVVHCSTAAERARVPEHKRLENATPGCGLPIGNLSSQFFANVYLDRLDQFVKHTLKVPRYLRYVDDFVLVHRNRAELEYWQRAIEEFLRDELRLELKADIRLRPLTSGIDFLGYVVFPTHMRVRQRVVRHAFAAIKSAGNDHRAAVLDSYLGHFSHANAFRLSASLIEASRK